MPTKLHDNVPTRGRYGSQLAGTATFIGLRTLDIAVQYTILSKGVSFLNKIGIPAVDISPYNVVAFGLPLKSVVLLAMAVGSTVKQNIWAAFIAKEEIPVRTGVMVGIFNTVCNSLNSLASLTLWSQPMRIQGEEPWVVQLAYLGLGTTLYSIGLITELVSEIQRKRFKDQPKNKGEVYTGGLFSLARHINYGAYTIWRAGYALTAGGFVWSSLVGTFFAADFIRRGVPVLDEYCAKRVSLYWK